MLGGTGGLGEAICTRLAGEGLTVAIGTRSDPPRAEALAARLGGGALAVRADVTDPPGLAMAVARATAAGPLRTLVFAAGRTAAQHYLSQIDDKEMRAAFEVETFGFQNAVRAALPALRAAQGSIVHIGSAGARAWAARDALSIVPKAANEALVRGLAREEGRYGVRANSVLVGVIEGGMFERLRAAGELDDRWLAASRDRQALKRFGTPADVAAAVAYLASDEAGYVTGETIAVAGGLGV